jgi:hypothetical protein
LNLLEPTLGTLGILVTLGTHSFLVPEVSHSCKDHGDVIFIRCGNHLIVSNRAAGLDDGRGA